MISVWCVHWKLC